MTVVDVLSAWPAGRGANALVGDGAILSHAEVADRVDARAGEIRASGLGEGDVAPVVVGATVAGIVDILARWRIGAVPVPLNARLTDAEIAAAGAALDGATFPQGTQVVLWTSGTSGRPRGVALSWANLEASARAATERLALEPTDVWVASLSPAHVGGLALLTRSILIGCPLVVPDTRETARLSRILDGEVIPGLDTVPHGVVPTHLSVVPTQLLRLLEHRRGRGAPGNLRCVLVGGDHTPASLLERALNESWPVALTYGATEMTSQIATAPPELVRASPGTVGPPLAGVEVRVDGVGELLARGPTRALGYVGGALGDDGGRVRPAALGNAKAEVMDGGERPEAEDWYRTGDLGRIDEHGRLWITGRRSDRIVSGGVTVDALEVEEALRSHPTVLDACVVGVPDEEWGERVGAWIEPVVGEFGLEELERYLRERLTAAKRPRLWRVGDGLPRNANGKVDRSEVRRALESR